MPVLLLFLSFLFAAACVAFLVTGLRDRARGRHGAAGRWTGDELRARLARRLADGEISPADYRARLRALQDTGMVPVGVDELMHADKQATVGPPATASAYTPVTGAGVEDGPVTFGDPMFVVERVAAPTVGAPVAHDRVPADASVPVDSTLPLPQR